MKISRIIFLALCFFPIHHAIGQDASTDSNNCFYIQSVDFSKPVLSTQQAADVEVLVHIGALAYEPKTGSDRQQFKLIDAGDDYVYIQNIKLGKVIGYYDGFVFTDLDHDASQKFKIEASPRKEETYYISGENGVLQIVGDGTTISSLCELNVKTDYIAGQKFQFIACEQ